MRMALEDLPPKMRKQAMKIIAAEDAQRAAALQAATKAQNLLCKDFDSKGEYEYYIGTICPKIKSGEVSECIRQPEFELFPKTEFMGKDYRRIVYTPDFRLDYADGSTEIIEVKSWFVRKMQRDYPLRRRLFIEKYARPNGWRFTEILTDDTKNELEEWKKGGRG